MAAGGLINPVTGRWTVKSWRIDDLLPVAEKTYRTIESSLGISVYHPLPLRRYCLNGEDIKRIGRRLRNPRYADVLGPYMKQGEHPLALKDEFGSYTIKQAAYLDIPKLLESLRAYLNCIDELFQHSQLTPSKKGWHYKGIHAKRVFFCEGTSICNNPWFRHLPVSPIKGETLLLKSTDIILPKGIFHHQKWILSLGDGHYRIGSTYDENDSSPLPTQNGADELLSAIEKNTKASFQQLEHKAGLRPSTPDSRPVLGAIPGASHLYVFNGLGSKGASTGPLMCQWLLRHCLQEASLDSEIGTDRFQALQTT